MPCVRDGAGNSRAFRSSRIPRAAAAIPDPSQTRRSSAPGWTGRRASVPPHSEWLALYRRLLALRHREIVPLLAGMNGRERSFSKIGEQALHVRWSAGGAGARVARQPAGSLRRCRPRRRAA